MSPCLVCKLWCQIYAGNQGVVLPDLRWHQNWHLLWTTAWVFVNGYWHNTISACQNVLHYNKMLLHDKNISRTWEHYDMAIFSTLLVFCERNLLVTSGFHHKGSVMQSSGFFFVFRFNILFVKWENMMVDWCYLWKTKRRLLTLKFDIQRYAICLFEI